MTINWETTKEDGTLILQIAQRAETLGWDRERIYTVMDLTACHMNGCPLDLQRMLDADDFNLMHDVAGIARHIDQQTGQLGDCFLPRFHKPLVESVPGGEPNRFRLTEAARTQL